MRALLGCTRCGHVERTRGQRRWGAARDCPDCGFPLKDIDLLGARLLIRATRGRQRTPRGRHERLVEQAPAAGRRLDDTKDAPGTV